MKVVRAALTFSLAACLVSSVLAGPYSDLNTKLSHAKTDEQKLQILQNEPLVSQNEDLAKDVLNASTGDDHDAKASVEVACNAVEALALAENEKAHPSAKSVLTDIKRSPFYSDPGEKSQSNWLGHALETLKHLMGTPSNSEKPDVAIPNIGPFLIWLVWGILGIALIAFVAFALSRINFAELMKRKSNEALQDEDEPDRTLDEWLQLADKLEAEGKYREAVRGLYLACLLKIDEARIARFDRGQTNWEHLERIESSPRLPEGLNFRSPTQAFDRIWYGYQVRGVEDVNAFRGWYREITELVRKAAA